jgi:hypothetical protein
MRLQFTLKLAIVALLSCPLNLFAEDSGAAAKPKVVMPGCPNIVYILCDDLGIGDLRASIRSAHKLLHRGSPAWPPAA